MIARRVVAIATTALFVLAPTVAGASWLVTAVVGSDADAAGIPVPFDQRIWMTFRGPTTTYPPAGMILSYASYAAFRIDAPKMQPTCAIPDPATCIEATTVMFDIESWRFTPHAERTGKSRPYRYMRRFVSVAHAYGLKVGLCPSMRWLPGGQSQSSAALRVRADWFVIQLYIPGGRDLSDQVRVITAGFHGPVYFKLAAIPTHDMPYLLSEWRTVRHFTSNFVVWGGRPKQPDSVQVALDFLRRFM